MRGYGDYGMTAATAPQAHGGAAHWWYPGGNAIQNMQANSLVVGIICLGGGGCLLTWPPPPHPPGRLIDGTCELVEQVLCFRAAPLPPRAVVTSLARAGLEYQLVDIPRNQNRGKMPRQKADAKPRGRMTAYAFFVQTCREEHKKKHPDENVIFAEFSKKCAERWKYSNPDTVGCYCDDGWRQAPSSELNPSQNRAENLPI
uniref:(California timema) hypothetical protein n=1 Tax=Timema californicum TaxID=61474 RepID=A0A7R9JCT2_TIMCA|nr:unnamed protein product [Timema californicum]